MSLVQFLMLWLQTQAIRAELLDPREAKYTFSRPEDLAEDLSGLVRRWYALRDAPPAHDAMGWPTRDHCNNMLAFNRQYQQHLEQAKLCYAERSGDIDEAIQQCNACWRTWDLIRDARTEYYYIHVRRAALRDLRQQIGFAAYYSGRLPPIVPLALFAEDR
jgi:hypothetical protein